MSENFGFSLNMDVDVGEGVSIFAKLVPPAAPSLRKMLDQS